MLQQPIMITEFLQQYLKKIYHNLRNVHKEQNYQMLMVSKINFITIASQQLQFV